MNHQSHIPTVVLMMTFVPFAGVALAETEPDDRWTGGGKPCSGGNANWSTDANWESGVAPSSGDLWINANDVCDPCDYGFCVFPCQPPQQCSGECSGGPNHGRCLSCHRRGASRDSRDAGWPLGHSHSGGRAASATDRHGRGSSPGGH